MTLMTGLDTSRVMTVILYYYIYVLAPNPPYPTPGHNGTCPDDPDDWFRYGDNCYLFRGTLTRAQDADLRCSRHGGHLTSVHSDQEAQFMYVHLLPIASGKYWNGLLRTRTGKAEFQ